MKRNWIWIITNTTLNIEWKRGSVNVQNDFMNMFLMEHTCLKYMWLSIQITLSNNNMELAINMNISVPLHWNMYSWHDEAMPKYRQEWISTQLATLSIVWGVRCISWTTDIYHNSITRSSINPLGDARTSEYNYLFT